MRRIYYFLIFSILAVVGCTLLQKPAVNETISIIGESNVSINETGEEIQPEDGLVCTLEYAPVCGVDGKTYSNKCFAGDVEIAYEGVCKEEIAKKECIDSDNGENIYTKGYAHISKKLNEAPLEDTCETPALVIERYCENSEVLSKKVLCPNGFECMQGACAKTRNETEKCADSDGNDIYTIGKTSVDDMQFTDICSAPDAVREYICLNQSIIGNVVQCPSAYSCINGACVQNIQTCSDPDNLNEFNATTVKVTLPSGFIHEYIDTCDTGKVKEFYCDNNEAVSKNIDCQKGYECYDGYCRRFRYCFDFDGGKEYEKASITTIGDNIKNDTCVDGDTVREYYCEDGNSRSEDKDCKIGQVCKDGACQ